MLSQFGNEEVSVIFNTQPVYPVGVLAKRFKYPDLEKLRAAISKLSYQSWSLNATQLAMKLNAPIIANIIMLGALVGTNAIPISIENVKSEIKNSLPSNKVELNWQALDIGYQAIK